MKVIKYQIDHKQKLIYETIKGEISSKEFLELQKAIIDDPEHDYSYSILSDIRDSSYNYSEDTAQKVYVKMRKLLKPYHPHSKCAFVTHKPMEVVRSYLYKKEMKNHSPIEYKTFSTIECAKIWLNVYDDL